MWWKVLATGNSPMAEKNGSIGLIRMRDCGDMLGRIFEIEAKDSNGTRARAHVPPEGSDFVTVVDFC